MFCENCVKIKEIEPRGEHIHCTLLLWICQWSNPGFPRQRMPAPKAGVLTYYFDNFPPKNCMKLLNTRVRSSRMCTVRRSSHQLGGVCPGGCLPGGMSAWGRVCPGVYTSPSPVNRQTPIKT